VYVQNAWYVAAWSHEIAPLEPVGLTILGEPIVVFRTDEGQVVALEDRCVHRLAPLSLGRCEGARLRCMYHGMLYGADGRVVEIPGQDRIPPAAKVRSYTVVDRHSWIWIWMGAAEDADESLIPAAVGLDDPNYVLGHGQLDYAAEARLINDNLLDFSHLSFVHPASFGTAPEFADEPGKIVPIERGIRYERWVEHSPGGASRQANEPLDRFMTYDFVIPGVLLMTGGLFPLGTARASDFAAPDLSAAVGGVTFTSQAVTPVGEKTSRYFFSWGPRKGHGDEAHRDLLMSIAAKAFAEDKMMIEAQQKVVDGTPNPRIMPTAHDRGLTMFNRMVERLWKQEVALQTAA
jgi:phenylpropionate dioxygenase-like ring-hydroxylating dioxygenase large terminal subunit